MSTVGFYVTMQRGSRTAWLLGPFPDHEEALSHVEDGRRLAARVDSFAQFDAFGTARRESITGRELPKGKLSHLLEEESNG